MVKIIAEAGVNHNGSIKTAFDLVDAAVEAGADIIKFQTGDPTKVISQFAEKAEYQKSSTGKNESQLDMVKKLELPFEDFKKLKDYTESKGKTFLSTPFELDALAYLMNIGMSALKVPSGEITNLPLLRAVASYNTTTIVSTGMATMDEIKTCTDILLSHGLDKAKLTILHCNTEYPTPYKDVNLTAMTTIRNELDVNVGYSDHTLGIEVPIAATALGASVIEKHITLDRGMTGPDHSASIEPHEFAAMVKSIRNIEKAITGSGQKEPSPSEKKNIPIARRSIHAARKIAKGSTIKE